MGELTRITTLLDTGEYALGLALMGQQLPQRIRSKKTRPGKWLLMSAAKNEISINSRIMFSGQNIFPRPI
jgi:hypothetical protein